MVLIDWYDNRHQLKPGMVFKDQDDDIVVLDRRVPGDGTKWYVGVFSNGSFGYWDDTVEPGDLKILLASEVDLWHY